MCLHSSVPYTPVPTSLPLLQCLVCETLAASDAREKVQKGHCRRVGTRREDGAWRSAHQQQKNETEFSNVHAMAHASLWPLTQKRC